MTGSRQSVLRVLSWLLASLPGVALACPMCLQVRDQATQIAFLLTTVLLSALPVLMIGGGIVWLARRAHAMDLEEREQTAPLEAEAAAVHVVQPEPAEPTGELVPLRR
jgi:hypothetical protein